MTFASALFKSGNSFKKDWEKQDNVVTHNDVIDAYIRGKEVGRNEQEVALKALFSENLNKAKSISEKLYNEIMGTGISVNSIHLKADEITNFFALVITSQDDYVRDDFGKAIRLSRQLKKKSDNDTFQISFSFTYNAESLNEKCLDSDGYFLKYGLKH